MWSSVFWRIFFLCVSGERVLFWGGGGGGWGGRSSFSFWGLGILRKMRFVGFGFSPVWRVGCVDCGRYRGRRWWRRGMVRRKEGRLRVAARVGEEGVSLPSLEEVVKQRTRRVCVVLDQVANVRNLAAACRSCDAFGVQDLHVVPKKYQGKKATGKRNREILPPQSRYTHQQTALRSRRI